MDEKALQRQEIHDLGVQNLQKHARYGKNREKFIKKLLVSDLIYL